MQVYHYDEETKEFLYEEEAFIDPLETELKGENVYLLPANATFEKPLEKEEGKAVVFDGDTWQLVDDNRGKFTIKDGSIQEIKTLGAVERILTDKEVEKINKGELIIDGSDLREKNVEELQAEVRAVRNSYLEKYVDPKQLVLVWDGLSEEERQLYADYRTYLLDYTELEGWYLQNPKTLDEWKQSFEVITQEPSETAENEEENPVEEIGTDQVSEQVTEQVSD